MLPAIAYNLLQSIELLATASTALADKTIRGFVVNRATIEDRVNRNPILVTALNPVIGHDKAAKIAKKAYREGLAVLEVAEELTDLPKDELVELLDPSKLASPGPKWTN